jgi:hypothetical protein
MKWVLVPCVALAMGFSTLAFGRGGGMHHSSGGTSGTSAAAPGTNSLGTALSSSGGGNRMKGPALGTGDVAVDREDAKVDKMVKSICRGC